jgi:hypothetical protein
MLAARLWVNLADQYRKVLVLYAAEPFLKSAGDTELSKRQDHGANADVRLRAFANRPRVLFRSSLGPHSGEAFLRT